MKHTHVLPFVSIAVLSSVALTGCSAVEDVLHNESSVQYDTAAELDAQWQKTAPWLPEDASDIQIHESTSGDPAVLLSVSAAALDPELCVEVERQSAATFSEDWSPSSYVDEVLACGDWAVIPTDTGWYGWTPNHPEEKAASLALSAE